MKIIARVCNIGAAANVGGDPDIQSAIIEIPDENIPQLVKSHLDYVSKVKTQWAKGNKNISIWSSISFSILDEG